MLDLRQDAALKLQDQEVPETVELAKAGPYFPDKVGGASQCLSIWFMALVHSLVQAVASCSICCALGVLPPHIEGLAASCRACLGIKFLIIVSKHPESVRHLVRSLSPRIVSQNMKFKGTRASLSPSR